MQPRGRAIVLIGFMGTGKSSVGRELARRTGLPRYDTDEIVTARLGLPITRIFDRHGEQGFRDAEAEALADLPSTPSIIVTGGGALLREGHAEKVRSLGSVVLLSANFETLSERLARTRRRPLLRTDDRDATIRELLAVREPLYRAAAECEIDTSGLTHAEVADAVLAWVQGRKHNGN